MNTIFVADSNWGLGKKNDLLFHLKNDMRHFVEHTKGRTVVMGYNTLLSFPNGMPLKGRTNIVLYPDGDIIDAMQKGYILATSLDELFALLQKQDIDNTYVVGGAMMYRTLLPYCTYAYVTKVEADGHAEVFHENLDKLDNWELIETGEPIPDGDNGELTIRFCTYRNNAPTPIPTMDLPKDADERIKRVAEKVAALKK